MPQMTRMLIGLGLAVVALSANGQSCPYGMDCLDNPYGAGSPYKADGLMNPYCQYELLQAHPEETHLSLYRGINRMDEHEILETLGRNRYRVLLNIFISTR